MDASCAGRDPALRQGDRLAGPLDYRVVVAALEHLARGLAEARLVAVGQRQQPVAAEQQREAEQNDGAQRIGGGFFKDRLHGRR